MVDGFPLLFSLAWAALGMIERAWLVAGVKDQGSGYKAVLTQIIELK